MANKKITDLTEPTEAASDDYLEIVDTSANTSKKISLENLIAGHDHDSDYLGISAKAADSDKLDGIDSTGFATAEHNHDAAYLGISAKAADSDKLDGNDSTYFMPQSYKDGWIPVSDTWTYASATTITVPAGAASIYSVGDKFRLTANSVVLQGYIVKVENKLLTVVGNPLTDHTFSNISYSKSATPLGFPHWFSWTPTIGYTGGSGKPTITAEGRYMIVGKTVFLLLTGYLTRSGATHAYLTFTTPTSISMFGSGSFTHQFLNSFSNGAVYKTGSGSDFTVMTGAWTADGHYWFSGFYEKE